jgi:hypothetical protein
VEAPSKLPDPMIWAPADGELIKSPKDAINVFDFEPVAHKNVPPAHFGYMASGIDDGGRLRANRAGVLEIPAVSTSGNPGAVHCLSSAPVHCRLWKVLGFDRGRKKPRSTTRA